MPVIYDFFGDKDVDSSCWIEKKFYKDTIITNDEDYSDLELKSNAPKDFANQIKIEENEFYESSESGDLDENELSEPASDKENSLSMISDDVSSDVNSPTENLKFAGQKRKLNQFSNTKNAFETCKKGMGQMPLGNLKLFGPSLEKKQRGRPKKNFNSYLDFDFVFMPEINTQLLEQIAHEKSMFTSNFDANCKTNEFIGDEDDLSNSVSTQTVGKNKASLSDTGKRAETESVEPLNITATADNRIIEDENSLPMGVEEKPRKSHLKKKLVSKSAIKKPSLVAHKGKGLGTQLYTCKGDTPNIPTLNVVTPSTHSFLSKLQTNASYSKTKLIPKHGDIANPASTTSTLKPQINDIIKNTTLITNTSEVPIVNLTLPETTKTVCQSTRLIPTTIRKPNLIFPSYAALPVNEKRGLAKKIDSKVTPKNEVDTLKPTTLTKRIKPPRSTNSLPIILLEKVDSKYLKSCQVTKISPPSGTTRGKRTQLNLRI